MLRTCRSPNITQYYGSAVLPGTSRLLIAMELMAVSLADLVAGDLGMPAPLSEPAIAHVMREVLSALVYLHSQHRIHRDVKAANILLSTAGDVKVRGWGGGCGGRWVGCPGLIGRAGGGCLVETGQAAAPTAVWVQPVW